jgi:hypothetical protein
MAKEMDNKMMFTDDDIGNILAELTTKGLVY